MSPPNTIGIVSPHHMDGCSWYRAHGVWAPLARKLGLNIIAPKVWDWTEILKCDVLFVSRPTSKEHRMVCEIAYMHKVPVWVDLDDDLFAVPVSNPAFDYNMTPEAHDTIRKCIAMASIATVSTKALAQLIKGADVVPNALNDYVFQIHREERKKVISWRGSFSHYADMAPFIPALARLSKRYPDWEWHFFGHPHWGINEIQNANRHAFNDNIVGFMHEMNEVRPAINIVTLVDNRFNQAKSNIAWLEGTQAGAVSLVPDWVEWKVPGACLYTSPEHFETQLEFLMKQSHEYRIMKHETSAQYIQEHLLLSNVNNKRLEVWDRFKERVRNAPKV